jgi:hypothetical protein
MHKLAAGIVLKHVIINVGGNVPSVLTVLKIFTPFSMMFQVGDPEMSQRCTCFPLGAKITVSAPYCVALLVTFDHVPSATYENSKKIFQMLVKNIPTFPEFCQSNHVLEGMDEIYTGLNTST